MNALKNALQNATVRRFLILLLAASILWSLHSILDLILLVFLVTYLMNRAQQYITQQLNKLFPVNYRIVVILLYVLILSFMAVGISNYLPSLIAQLKQLTLEIQLFINTEQHDELARQIQILFQNFDLQVYAKHGLGYALKISKWLEIVLFVILLSLFFLLQKSSIMRFTNKFRTSKIGWFYKELEYLGGIFVHSFGKVIEAQLLIALFNTLLTTIGLWILGFPYLFVLSVLILLLSLIPVAGVIISLIPLCLIGLQIGGVQMIVYVLILIVIIHALESYFLNPKLMSSKTELPMFYTFVILIFSQHYFGIWGLILGIPIFMFLLELLDVNVRDQPEHT